MELPEMFIIWSDPNLWIAATFILFNPIYWNALARWEYQTRRISRICGSPYRACYALAVTILILGLYRDWRYQLAVSSQPSWWFLRQNWLLWTGHTLFLLGTVLVITSFWALGFTATFLGDYFNILLPERVTSFPFSLMNNPMYTGSAMVFMGYALIQASQAGIILSLLVFFMYRVAAMFEGPFTSKIYRTSEQKVSDGKAS